MSVILVLNQSSASLRNVSLPPLVQSNGTSACTNESGRTFFFELGGTDYGSGGSLSAISAAAGLYTCNFSASKVSVVGQGSVYYSSGTALPARTPIEIVRVDSMNSQDFGLAAFSEVSIHAGTHSNVTIKGVQNAIIADGTYSAVSVRHQAGDYGSITTFGVSKILAGSYSGVTFGVLDIKPGTYSGVTVGIDNIKAASYSGVSVGALDIKPASYSGVTVGIDNIKGASYSDVTIQGISNYKNISSVTLNAGLHSGASVEIKTGGIQAASFGANAIDAGALATDAGQEIADRWSARNVAGGSDTGRTNAQAMYALRNRVVLSGLTGTVYQVDDTTSSWTFSIATVAASSINEIDPGGV